MKTHLWMLLHDGRVWEGDYEGAMLGERMAWAIKSPDVRAWNVGKFPLGAR